MFVDENTGLQTRQQIVQFRLLQTLAERSQDDPQFSACQINVDGFNAVAANQRHDVAFAQAQHIGQIDPDPASALVQVLEGIRLMGERVIQGDPMGCQGSAAPRPVPNPVHRQIVIILNGTHCYLLRTLIAKIDILQNAKSLASTRNT